MADIRLPARPFFLQASAGDRFCLFHSPAAESKPAGAILYVHPFGDEMNLSRRMAALQSRAFANTGWAVLQMDLYGCGDSDGDLRTASWETWIEDIAAGVNWLREHVDGPIAIWGLRLGATLALDYVRRFPDAVNQLVLWQPVITGKIFMTQFLRLGAAAGIFAQGGAALPATERLRSALLAGQSIEVAGYELTPSLIFAIERADMSGFAESSVPVYWFEVVSDSGTPVPKARTETADAWICNGVTLSLNTVGGSPFWSTKEISECDQLISATTRLLSGMQS